MDDISQWIHKDILACKYVAYSCETGDSGTPHLQGYCCFSKNRRLGAMKDLLPRAHWETMKGNINQNEKYCSKQVASSSIPTEIPYV